MNTKLEKIAKKYQAIKFNEDNYRIGGGLTYTKFASNRHEDAKEDKGKLTEGQAAQLFKKATGLELGIVKAIINYAVPDMEWHHAGKLPKEYGGGMKKTYFLNAIQIMDLAQNWDDYFEKYQISITLKKSAEQTKKELEKKKLEFLEANAKRVIRVTNRPKFFYKTSQEMKGKFGWFDSKNKPYNMTEYYSGWEFESEEKFNEFLKIEYFISPSQLAAPGSDTCTNRVKCTGIKKDGTLRKGYLYSKNGVVKKYRKSTVSMKKKVR